MPDGIPPKVPTQDLLTTPITWDPHVWPEPEEWLAWFDSCTRSERLMLATRMQVDMKAASRCFLMNHDSRIEELTGQVVGLRQTVARHEDEGQTDD